MCRPYGTRSIIAAFPALKGLANIARPSGAHTLGIPARCKRDCKMHKSLYRGIGALILFSSCCVGQVKVTATLIDVNLTTREMKVSWSDKTFSVYHVALGRAGVNCTREKAGDNCTPQGTFFIAGKHESSRFHKFLLLSYPDAPSAKRGFDAHTISADEYQTITNSLAVHQSPPQNTALGGNIGIHGQPTWIPAGLQKWVSDFNWTAACVSVTNREIDQIYDRRDVGTPVVIHR